MKQDSTRQAGTGVAWSGLKGNGEHEVQGVAFSLGPGHGGPGRMSGRQHPFLPAGRNEFYITGTAGAREASDHNEHGNTANRDFSTVFI